MAHDHHLEGHDHDHARHHHGGPGHIHAPVSFGASFAIGIVLNFGFVVLEATYGVIGHSVALLSDAGHNLGDVLGLAVAWLASELVRRPPSERFTYGLRNSSILAALFNAMFLLVTVGAISLEAIRRFSSPEPVAGVTVMIVAAIGVIVNGTTALLFASGRKDDLNLRSAFVHMSADAVIATGVLVAGLLIELTGRLWLDPAVSLAINLVIAWSTWGLLRDSLGMSMAGVPQGVDPTQVRAFLVSQPSVASLHDLHIWPMSTTEIALTCHLVMPAAYPDDAFIHALALQLADRFRINHSTIQIETGPTCSCALASDEVV